MSICANGHAPTPSHYPIQTVAGVVVGTLPHQVDPTKCLPCQGHRLASPASLGVAWLTIQQGVCSFLENVM